MKKIIKVELTKLALKDIHKLKAAGLIDKSLKIRDILTTNPYTLAYEKLTGVFAGKYSGRINIKHRIVYEVYE